MSTTTTVPSRVPDTAADPDREVVVASVPSAHVYVRHLQASDGDEVTAPRVRRLPDPDPDGGNRSAVSRWWPPLMLDAEWIRAHRDFDLLHLHFGFDARTPAQLAELVATLHAEGKPFVYTVHDLRNPHHPDRAEHDAQLDVLVPAADALITLTPGAAEEIRRRWGRTALVLPHPHVVDETTMRRVQERHGDRHADGTFRVGLHVKSLRASMDPRAILPALLRAVEQVPGGILQVDGHTDVLDPGGARHDPDLLAALRAAGDSVDVRVHDFFDDDELFAYLASLDASVLPYRFGTHSGWLEACRDLGTAVIAPSCGFYREQGPVLTYTMDEASLDEDSLVQAVLEAHRAGPATPVPVEQRRAQRAEIARAHAGLYAGLVG